MAMRRWGRVLAGSKASLLSNAETISPAGSVAAAASWMGGCPNYPGCRTIVVINE
jgi:hypothetical protein